MQTTLTIGGIPYTNAQRAAAFLTYDELTLSLEGYGSFAFSEHRAAPAPSFDPWTEVSLSNTDGVKYSGWVTDIQTTWGDGIVHGYTVSSLKWVVDRYVAFEASDGTGLLRYNTSPEDVFGSPSDRGLTVGQIIERALTVVATATILDTVGVGGYTSLSPPTLPSSTLAGLALLDVVPNSEVVLQGKGIFNVLSQLVVRWMPQFVLELLPTGEIAVKDLSSLTDFVPQSVTLPSRYGNADPVVGFPRIRCSVADVATRVLIRGGPEVEAAMLSLADGTLAEGFDATDKSNWTLYSFTQPGDASDSGTLSSVTSTSASLTSDDATAAWTSNFWANREGTIFLLNSVGTGITVQEQRAVTTNTSLTAGGSSTVSWDTNWPITNADFTNYRIVGGANGIVDTWRLYLVADPLTGDTGTDTFIGSHLVRYSPLEVKWANLTTTLGTHFSQGSVRSGTVPSELPEPVEPVPYLGGFRFKQPTVMVSGSESKLKRGSPTTVADGLPSDVKVLALYSKGPLTVASPPDVAGVPQYSGTAAAFMHVNEVIDVPGWMWKNDAGSMQILADKHHASMSDVNYDVSFEWGVGADDVLPSWDWLDFGTSLNVFIEGMTSPWEAINAPVRSVSVKWGHAGGANPVQTLSFSASNRKKAFTGGDLYTHPQFSAGSAFGGGGSGEIPLEIMKAVMNPLGTFAASGGGADRVAGMMQGMGAVPGISGDVLGSLDVSRQSALNNAGLSDSVGAPASVAPGMAAPLQQAPTFAQAGIDLTMNPGDGRVGRGVVPDLSPRGTPARQEAERQEVARTTQERQAAEDDQRRAIDARNEARRRRLAGEGGGDPMGGG